MGTITTGVGLVSGIDTASLIESLLAIESRGKVRLEDRVTQLQGQQTALLDINARLLNLKNAAGAFRLNDIFDIIAATSSDEEVLTATATTSAQPGSYRVSVGNLVSNSQQMTGGFADLDTTPLGLEALSFEFGRGRLQRDVDLTELNGGLGVSRGSILVTDADSASATVDLTDVVSINEVVQRINDATGVSVTAEITGNGLTITDTSGGPGTLTIADVGGRTTAAELGIAGTAVGGIIAGTDINFIGATTALTTLNDGTGVLIQDNVPDLQITARDGSQFEIDLGRLNADIDTDTRLSDLNNGLGVTISDDSENPDIAFTTRTGTEYEVNLNGVTTVGGLIGRISSRTGGDIVLSVTDGERLTVTDTTGGGGNLVVSGAGSNGADTATDLGILNAGVAADSFDGTLIPNTISDPPALTAQDVIDRINESIDTLEVANGGRIAASIGADGVSIQIDDTTGGGGNLIIVGAPGTSDTANAAANLGLFTGDLGVAASTVAGDRVLADLGSVLVSSLNGGEGLAVPEIGDPQPLSGTTLLSELFNGAGVTTNGDPFSNDLEIRDRDGTRYDIEVDDLVTAQDFIDRVDTVSAGAITVTIEGDALRVTDNTGGGGNLRIRDRNGASVASELGIEINDPVDTVLGVDTAPIYSTSNAEITITNRLGGSTVIDVADDENLVDIINRINDAGAGVTASLNAVGNGLAITDTTGGTGNLKIGGTTAAALGISGSVAADTLEGSNLQLRYVSESSKLSQLNYGRGVGAGSFRITDGTGATAEVSIGSDSETLYDVINEINSRGLAVTARLNDTGDGLLIEENLPAESVAFVPIKVESINGSAATDLNILGESETVEGGFIDGSYERVVDLDVADDLGEVVGKINGAGIPVAASILNTGSGATPYRISFTSEIGGRNGDLLIDSGAVDLGLTVLQEGKDAKVFLGSERPEDALLVTSDSNTIKDAINGVTLDIVAVSEEPITLTLARDADAVVEAVTHLVTTFNDSIGRINEYDFFNVETEERGVLLSNPVTSRVRQALYRVATGVAENVQTQYRTLGQVGIRVGANGELTFDEERFLAAYDNDREAVKNLFAAFEESAGTTSEIAPGVTVSSDDISVTARGFGELFDDLMDRLTNSIDGTLTRANQNFDDLIRATNDRITLLDERLDVRRLKLEAEFASLESALAKLQSQGNSLASLSTSFGQLQGGGG